MPVDHRSHLLFPRPGTKSNCPRSLVTFIGTTVFATLTVAGCAAPEQTAGTTAGAGGGAVVGGPVARQAQWLRNLKLRSEVRIGAAAATTINTSIYITAGAKRSPAQLAAALGDQAMAIRQFIAANASPRRNSRGCGSNIWRTITGFDG